ncbi:MAG: hypothetical protein IKN09_00960 [Clostridia bacterium]|nr:hypothetical protein [Clostridia bacterium]MBR4261149.1 hypothetical protein [Clostridia bacterium]
MKKIIALLVIAATAGLVGTGAYQYGRISNNEEVSEINYEEFYKTHAYEQVVPDAQITKGDKQAVGKIETFVGQNLTVGNPWPLGSSLEESVVRGKDDLMYLYKVEDYSDKDISVFFLFNDDVDVVRADKSSKNYVDHDEEHLTDYSDAIKDTNYVSNPDVTAYAWKFKTESYAAASKVCTSVWALENGSELHLIWCNMDCPIWTDYNG